jgi:hypothetical protein
MAGATLPMSRPNPETAQKETAVRGARFGEGEAPSCARFTHGGAKEKSRAQHFRILRNLSDAEAELRHQRDGEV